MSSRHFNHKSKIVNHKWSWKGCKPNSVCALRRRESFVCAADTRNPFHFRETRSGPLRGFLFGLAPDGVFRAASLALRAVRSYRTFSPSPPACAGGCLFSVALSVGTARAVAARVYPKSMDLGYAASRPLVFGLSSSGLRRKRFSALPKPIGILTRNSVFTSQTTPIVEQCLNF